MEVQCPECGNSEFSTLENKSEEFYYNNGTGRIVKDLECDNCNNIFRVKMDIKIKSVDIY